MYDNCLDISQRMVAGIFVRPVNFVYAVSVFVGLVGSRSRKDNEAVPQYV
jgi:hypothetical protein